MTSPLDTAFARRLLLAHLQAATSIATTFQNLPPFTPHPLPPAHQRISTPTSTKRSRRRTPPPPPPPTPPRSRSPPPTTGKSHLGCKPEPSPSYTPTSPHQHSPAQHKDTKTQQQQTHQNNTGFQQLTPPVTTISLNSSPSTPPPPPPPTPPPPSPLPPPKPPQALSDSPLHILTMEDGNPAMTKNWLHSNSTNELAPVGNTLPRHSTKHLSIAKVAGKSCRFFTHPNRQRAQKQKQHHLVTPLTKPRQQLRPHEMPVR